MRSTRCVLWCIDPDYFMCASSAQQLQKFHSNAYKNIEMKALELVDED